MSKTDVEKIEVKSSDTLDRKDTRLKSAFIKTVAKVRENLAKQEVRNFCKETTAHGISYTAREDIILPFRIFWICIFVVALIGNCWHLSTVVKEYLGYPVQEVTTMTHTPMRFPAVTVCNQLAMSETSHKIIINDNTSSYASFLAKIMQNNDALIQYENSTGIAMDDLLISSNGLYSNVDHQELIQSGHTLQDLIIFCSYAGKPCNMNKDFKNFFDPDYFNCYTFTGQETIGNSTSGAGPRNGLNFIAFTESVVEGSETLNDIYNRYSTTENSYGLRVHVHELGTLPSPRDSGINIMPGQSSSVALSMEKVTKLSHPYGQCSKNSSLHGLESYSYSSERCIDLCLSSFIYNKCGCVSSTYPVPQSIQQPYTYCSTLNNSIDTLTKNTECENKAWLEFSESTTLKKACSCIEPCEKFNFYHSTSGSMWPGNRFMRDMYYEFVEGHPNKTSLKSYQQLQNLIYDNNRTQEMKENVALNFARVNIYFGSSAVIERVQQPSYPMSTLWSNIGGTIGLWAGLSIITIMEVIFLFVKLCFVACNKKHS